MSTFTEEQLTDLLGVIGVAEYKAAPEWSKPKLDPWISALRDLPDQAFRLECEQTIYESALVNSFRGNWDHVHVKATASYHEAQRRHRLAGHREDCHGPTMYSQAHANVMRSHGYRPTPSGECVCSEVSR